MKILTRIQVSSHTRTQNKRLARAKRLARMQAKRRAKMQAKRRVHLHDYAVIIPKRSIQEYIAYFCIVTALVTGYLVSSSESLSVLAAGVSVVFIFGAIGVSLSRQPL